MMGIGWQELAVIAFVLACPVVTIVGVVAVVLLVLKKPDQK